MCKIVEKVQTHHDTEPLPKSNVDFFIFGKKWEFIPPPLKPNFENFDMLTFLNYCTSSDPY